MGQMQQLCEQLLSLFKIYTACENFQETEIPDLVKLEKSVQELSEQLAKGGLCQNPQDHEDVLKLKEEKAKLLNICKIQKTKGGELTTKIRDLEQQITSLEA